MSFQKVITYTSRHFYISKAPFFPVFSESGIWTSELSRRQFVVRSPNNSNKSLSLISSDNFPTYNVSSSSWPRIICFWFPLYANLSTAKHLSHKWWNKLIFHKLNLDFRSIFNTAWKMSKYGVISGPYFPAFWLNITPYSVWMRENTDQK